MATEFTVISFAQDWIGDGEADYGGAGPRPVSNEAFAGPEKQYSFRCPEIDEREPAVLHFRSFGVNSYAEMWLNDLPLRGAFPPSYDENTRTRQDEEDGTVTTTSRRPVWFTNVIPLTANTARENNVLKVATIDDDFYIDNIVIFFKTKKKLGPSPGSPVPPIVTR